MSPNFAYHTIRRRGCQMLPRKTMQYLLHRIAMQENEFILFNAQQCRHQPGRSVIHHILHARMDAEISV